MSNKLKNAKAKFNTLPRAIRWGTYATGGYLSYAMLLGLLVPYVAEQQAPEQLSKLIERPVLLGDVTINPFTLQFDIDKFAILEGEQPFVSFDKASLQLNFWQSIFDGALSVEYITLDKPYVNIERVNNPDSTEIAFNFSDILSAVERNSAPTADVAPEVEDVVDRHAPLFPVQIKQTALNHGDVRFKDNITGAELHYPDINLSLGEFATQSVLADNTNRYTLQINDADAAKIALKGQVQLKPLQVVGDISVENIQLPRLWGFIADDMQVQLASGTVNLASHYRLAQTIADTPDNDKLSISTNRGQFALDNLDIQANKKSIVSLPSLTVNNIATDVDQQTVAIESIQSHGLKLAAKVNQQGTDLVSLFTPKSLAQTSASKSAPVKESQAEEVSHAESLDNEASQPWLVTLDGVEIKDYQVTVAENILTPKANTWTIAPINLTTSKIVSDLSKPIDFDFFAAINGKGDIKVKGQADALKQAVAADVDVKSLKLAQFQPYLATAVKATLTNGELNTQATVKANANGDVTVNGGIQVNHLAIRDNKLKKPFVKWRSLAVNKFNFDLAKSKLDIDTLSLSLPYARVVINEDRSTNIGDLVVEQPKTSPSKTKATTASKDKPFALSVKKIAFNDGSAFFADNSLKPGFSSGIEQLKGQISQVSSVPGTKASVDISGNIDRYAPVKIKGEINPLIAQPYLDLDVLFKSVELTTVNPYSGTYAGYFIDKGQLTLDLNYKLDKNQLKGSNHVVIDQLQLGEASDSDTATQLPVKLAIALLQDNDGVIDMGVEVSGDVNDPSFNLGSVIWQTVSNIITKAVSAPFNFIAGLADSDEELNHIAFAFGSSSLSSDADEKLTSLGEGLNARPNLALSVDGSIDAVEDSKALALTKFSQKLAQQAQIEPDQLPDNLTASNFPTSGPLSDSLQALYKHEFGEDADVVRDKIEDELSAKDSDLSDEEIDRRWHIALYNLELNKQQISQAELGKLAQARAQAVKAYLVDVVKVDAAQVFLLDSRFDIEQDSSGAVLSLKAK
ncbi:DUF748 domain-containing protein [Vibrio taketomensis]|uniref:DUF748 domain-containing protein n=1 Tax=Vibrio taketomensis TaxID=2572923 RepID=UPI001389AFAC|nr:DUF748 domain-containing protein [Vibrio taketomensis]